MTRHLEGLSRHQLREAAAEFEKHGPDTCKILKKHIPGLDTAMEMVQRLIEMATADDAAEEAKRKKRVSGCLNAEGSDQHAKLRKMEDGGGKGSAGVACS
ncbi:hypothetical protein BRADI_1g25042v3 [Brachypodium distachyon]|uniref:Uncharacterized protein n=1 Tax=Brachypodium distachyon TaxID=15368 RepID=A0A2K2DKZ9_BRADI|nr:hypothetical protein BRADI_1g25042v3 [Brachypodium distachyon]